MIHLILQKHLNHFLNVHKQHIRHFDDVIFETVAYTMHELILLSHIPHQHLEIVEEFLREDAWDLLHLKTYGCPTLQSYRRYQQQKKPRKS